MEHHGACPKKDGKNKTNALDSTPNAVKRISIVLIQNLGIRKTAALGLFHPTRSFRFAVN